MGDNRNFKLVAQEFNVSETAVKVWSVSFGWMRRVKARDKAVRERVKHAVEELSVEGKAQTLLRRLKTVKTAISQFEENLLAGKVKLEETHDLQRLLAMESGLLSLIEQKDLEVEYIAEFYGGEEFQPMPSFEPLVEVDSSDDTEPKALPPPVNLQPQEEPVTEQSEDSQEENKQKEPARRQRYINPKSKARGFRKIP